MVEFYELYISIQWREVKKVAIELLVVTFRVVAVCLVPFAIVFVYYDFVQLFSRYSVIRNLKA
jgi:hypothetical protein